MADRTASGLAFTDDHLALAAVARSVLADRDALASARTALDAAPDGRPGFWKDVVSLGWTGLHLPEDVGGQGYGLAELAIVVEELGRVVAPGPFLPTVLAAAVLDEVGTDQQRRRWLPGLASGTTTAAVGLGGSVRLDGNRVSGPGRPVLGAADADLVLLVVGDDVVVLEGRDGVEHVDHRAVDPTLALGEIRLDGAPVAGAIPAAGAAARRLSWVLAAATAVGGLRACVEQSVAYAQVREQFGRPIGSFQAVKHHCANMLVAAELAAAATWDATRGGDGDEAELAAAVAAAIALDAYLEVAARMIQVHGGIAYTWEHDAHLHLRRAAALSALVGPADAVRTRVLELRRAGVERRAALDLPPESESVRAAARAFVAEQRDLPEADRRRHYARSGFLVPHWPRPYGHSAGAAEQLVLDEELAAIERPSLGLGEWVVPTIVQHGTQEQLDRWIWPSLEGQLRWCQLFSEPGAGSDAAAISTKAVKVEGGWVVNGQKVWTSDAMNCQWGMATVRTDPAAVKHAGISAMAIPLDADGVTVRPIREITGEALFNEVFFDDVFVPDGDVVGEPGNGWRVARAMLGIERITIGGGSTTMEADALVDILGRHRSGDDGLARDVGALLAEGQALRMLNVRHAARAVAGAEPGPEGNVAKLFGAEHAQRVSEAGMRILGAAALCGEDAEVFHDLLFSRCLTIAGGTSEVIRNQIAERILGLPREPGLR